MTGYHSELYLGYLSRLMFIIISRPHFNSTLAILPEHLFQELLCWPTLAADSIPDDQCHLLNIVHPHLVSLSLCQVPTGRHAVLVTRDVLPLTATCKPYERNHDSIAKEVMPATIKIQPSLQIMTINSYNLCTQANPNPC